jgi:hypothetical protein
MLSSVLDVISKAPVTKASSSCDLYLLFKLTVTPMLTLPVFTTMKTPKTLTVYAAELVMLSF